MNHTLVPISEFEFQEKKKNEKKGWEYLIRTQEDDDIKQVRVREIDTGEEVTELYLACNAARNTAVVPHGVCLPGVRKLVLAKEIRLLYLENEAFPNLEDIQVEAPNYLFAFDKETKTLAEGSSLRNVFWTSKETYHMPDKIDGNPITVIKNYAFSGTKFEEILFPCRNNIMISSSAFTGSVFLEKATEKGYAFVGTNLLDLRRDKSRPLEYICVPPNISCRKKMLLHANLLPCKTAEVNSIFDLIEYCSVIAGGKIVWHGPLRDKDIAHLNLNYDIADIELVDSNCVTNDGLVYSRGGEKILLCPRRLPKEEVKIKEGCVIVEPEAFKNNKTVQKVILPNSVTYIKGEAFKYACIKKVEFGKGLLRIGNKAFEHCRLEEIYIPGNVKKIGERAFGFTSPKTVTLEEGVMEIERDAFVRKGEGIAVELPKSMMFLHPGSLKGFSEVRLKNNRILGLLLALDNEKDVILVEETGKKFMIPAGLNEFLNVVLEDAWTCGIKYFESEYKSIPQHLQFETDAYQFELFAYTQDANKYQGYLKHLRLKAVYMVKASENKTDYFSKLANAGVMTPEIAKECLKISQEEQDALFTAMILEWLKEKGEDGENQFSI